MIGVALAVRPEVVGPRAAPAPDPTDPYVMQPGDGVVTGEHVPLSQALAGVIAGGVLFVVAVRTTDRRKRIAASLGVLTLILVATSIGPPNALAFTGGGYGLTPSRSVPEDQPGMYVAVTGNRPFTLVVAVGNTSRLPVELIGLASSDVGLATNSELDHLPRFVAMANLPQTALDGRYATRFERTTIEPGDFANVALLGLAGTCSIPAPAPEGQGGYLIESVNLVYEQLTITHTQAFQLPVPVVITTTIPCTS
ncbi:MAG TPA: hypothetical protein VFK35_11450 [Candidatus Limnocylindrales bacterium]|nr:hypothetical protein [Candidatus Limnocylindrales bacterium]